MQGQPAQVHKMIIEKMVQLTNIYISMLPLTHKIQNQRASPRDTAHVIQREKCWIQGSHSPKMSIVHDVPLLKTG